MNSILEKLILNENQFFNKIDLVTMTLYTENVRNQQVCTQQMDSPANTIRFCGNLFKFVVSVMVEELHFASSRDV